MSYLDHVEVIEGVEPDCADISLYFAKIMTSPHNQHVILRVAGKAGKGKSWLGLALSAGVAKNVSQILGRGNPEDYFHPKNDLAVISKPEVERVMANPNKYTVKFLDDVAAEGMNARNYRDKSNIDLNAQLTTFRPNHNLVVLTAQAGFLIDKVPRSLSHYVIEMDQSFFDVGVSLVKCFETELDDASGQPYRHYLRAAGGIYKRHLCYAPPKEVTDAYEIERGIQLARMMEKKEEEEKNPKLKKKDVAVSVIDGIVSEFNVSVEKACKIAGIDKTIYYRGKA